jgi:hypothetical protein
LVASGDAALEEDESDADCGFAVESNEIAGLNWRDGVSQVIADRVTFEIVSSGMILQSTF